MGARVIGAVHGDGLGIVIDRYVEAAEGAFDAEGGAAAPGEIVDDEAVHGALPGFVAGWSCWMVSGVGLIRSVLLRW